MVNDKISFLTVCLSELVNSNQTVEQIFNKVAINHAQDDIEPEQILKNLQKAKKDTVFTKKLLEEIKNDK